MMSRGSQRLFDNTLMGSLAHLENFILLISTQGQVRTSEAICQLAPIADVGILEGGRISGGIYT